MKAKDIYKDYDKRVQDYMQNVFDCLEQDYKKIPSSWRVSLDLIAANANIVFTTQDHIKKNGLLCVDAHNRTHRNQCFNMYVTAQGLLIKLLSSFGLSPMSKSKLKDFKSDDIDIDDLIN